MPLYNLTYIQLIHGVYMIYRKHFLPDREHGFSITKTDQLILLREIVAARSYNHTKNIVCGWTSEIK